TEFYTTEDGLPQDTMTAIEQSSDGYLWLGTYEGLVRFDGIHFTIFNKANTPEMKSNTIKALFKDSDHGLWIGTTHGGLPASAARTIFQDREGTIWIGTHKKSILNG
ncbi:MAG: hypothetical protein GY950_07030, partial [bacterium]|nr:hypothetical protein [bacterium]